MKAGRPTYHNSIAGWGKGVFMTASIRLWSLSIGFCGLFPQGKIERDVKLTSHLHIVPRLCVELYLLPHVFMAWCLFKNRNKLAFSFVGSDFDFL
jgi:hypothetical protein